MIQFYMGDSCDTFNLKKKKKEKYENNEDYLQMKKHMMGINLTNKTVLYLSFCSQF